MNLQINWTAGLLIEHQVALFSLVQISAPTQYNVEAFLYFPKTDSSLLIFTGLLAVHHVHVRRPLNHPFIRNGPFSDSHDWKPHELSPKRRQRMRIRTARIGSHTNLSAFSRFSFFFLCAWAKKDVLSTPRWHISVEILWAIPWKGDVLFEKWCRGKQVLTGVLFGS